MNEKKMQIAKLAPAGNVQSMVECDVNIEGGVAKVLSVQSSIRTVHCEVLNSEANFDGLILLKTFVLCQDGKMKTQNSEHKFSGKLANKELNSTTHINCKSKCMDLSVSSVSEKGAVIVCTVDTEAVFMCNDEIETADAENMQNMFLLNNETITWKVNNRQTARAEHEAEVIISSSDVQILNIENNIVIKSASSGEGFVNVKAALLSRIVYTTGENNEKIQTAKTAEDFSYELEVPGATKEGFVFAGADLCEEKFEAVMAEQGDKVIVMLKYSIMMNVTEYEKHMFTIVKDAYSETKHIELKENTHSGIVPLGETYCEKKIEGNIVLEESQPRCSRMILHSAPYLGSMQYSVEDGKAKIVGIAYANLIYETEDDGAEPASVQIEIPFDIKEDVETDAAHIIGHAVIDNVDITVKKGRTVFFDAVIKAHMCTFKNEQIRFVSDVKETADREAREGAIEIIFAKEGTTLWENAKKHGISIETILNQNPMLTDPLSSDSKIILFHRKTATF